jgi:hypothetical protein
VKKDLGKEDNMSILPDPIGSRGGKHTLFPPVPSTILPLLLSTTLAWNIPPNTLSKRLPNVPHTVVTRIHVTRSDNVLRIPLPPGTQNGIRIAEVRPIVNAPNMPAKIPVPVTPPFVPGGTTRREGEIMSRGLDFERMPNSEENVSAATAA